MRRRMRWGEAASADDHPGTRSTGSRDLGERRIETRTRWRRSTRRILTLPSVRAYLL